MEENVINVKPDIGISPIVSLVIAMVMQSLAIRKLESV
jgi:hypothetical protein